ncbi:MAG: hypothetical protein ACHQ52_04640 [Candidatus Eisenbacteria bacterium]
MPIRSIHRRILAGALMAVCAWPPLAVGADAVGGDAAGAGAVTTTPDGTVTEVRVERVKPPHEKPPTMRFLKANRAFIRSRFDVTREHPVTSKGDAVAVDPRFLAYQQLLASVNAGRDTVARDDAAARQREYLARVGELADLETQLDRMERLLAEQRDRLGVVQADFTGHPLTELIVVASGDPGQSAPATLAVALESGDTLVTTLTDEQRGVLARGGVVELYRGFVEPREQTLELTLAGGAWPATESGWLTLDPPRDRITLVRFDLATARPATGVAGIRASTWLHDGRLPAGNG